MKNCSKHFQFEDIYQCGETWKKIHKEIDNLPKQQETFEAIKKLCQLILDPIQDKFGTITLTYGFASLELTQKIKNRIYPLTDQHAGYEKKSNGEYICNRLGQAVDFKIDNVDSLLIARWIVDQQLPFDRMYYYGALKPIHISYGPDHKRQIIKMKSYSPGKLIPQVVKNL